MTTTLVIPESVARELQNAVLQPLETAGVLRTVPFLAPNGDMRVLARAIDWVSESAYLHRAKDSLVIASEGYVGSLGKAEALGEIGVWLHTHPGIHSSPSPSEHDYQVDREIADVFRLRTGSQYYGTLILSPREDGFAFTGTIQSDAGTSRSIDRIWSVGETWRLLRSLDAGAIHIPALFDRNVRAFGGDVQATLGDLKVGIVGCGGTGSAVAEQLVRLGVRNLVLLDPDHLSESNLTRVYGSTPGGVGRPKAAVLREHLIAIAPELHCESYSGLATNEVDARQLTICDVLFGCTDDNAGRMILSRLATYLMLPVIDMGVLIDSDAAGRITGINGRVTTIGPEMACLLCRNRIDVRRAAAEVMPHDERVRLAGEGYAPALAGIEPAVVSFTSAVAAAATAELLERLIGYGPSPRPTEVLLRFHEREVSTNVANPRARHYCHPPSGKVGAANLTPWLEQTWAYP